jgi:uncharacterized membrane protein YfcA
MHEFVLFIAGFLAAFIGTMSGGGAGLLSVATLIYFGLPVNQAIATNKFGDLGFFFPAIRNYTKAKQIKKKALPPIIAVNIIGVTIGTLLIARLDTDILRKIVAVILLVIIISSLKKKDAALKERRAKKYWPVIYFGSSVSSGAVGAGTGILGTLTLMYFRGFTALQAMAHNFYANMFGSALSVTILIFTGLINYRYAAFLLVGNLIGSHFGSKIAVKKGNRFVRVMITLLALAVLLQLLFLKN